MGLLRFLLMGLFILPITASSQCPDNIDFEHGNFDNWKCWVGNVAAINSQNVISLSYAGGPVTGHQQMYSQATFGGLVDYYGSFPVVCPNGSNYSVKLGNDQGGAEAEGLSYEFTIPATQNTYSVIYEYAVVFQDPNHLEFQQPRMEVEVTNLTDNQEISCSSFTFFPNGSPLPGFFMSPNSDSTPVWCKPWSAVTINLNNMAGKTIQLFFKTADCTFRRHFGYAYIDVNSECSGEFPGAKYCPDDTAVNLVAPFGYQSYTWFNHDYSQTLGMGVGLYLSPPPPQGDTVKVEVVPYDGYGCLDTLYAVLKNTLTLKADAGKDGLSCNGAGVLIGGPPKTGVVYDWTPIFGLSDPIISNPRASPAATTQYILHINSRGGGCNSWDSVIVKASFVDNSIQLTGKDTFCAGRGDSAILRVLPTNNIKGLMKGPNITAANSVRYQVLQSGNYSAILTNSDGCTATTNTETVLIELPQPGISYPLQYAVMNIPIQLQARTFGSSVLWQPGTYLDDPTITTPTFSAPVADLEEQYTIAIKTDAGCLTLDRQLVKTIKEVKIYVPNAFTPDNNGLNDYFKPTFVGVKELRNFRIYNRNGRLVYNMPDLNGRGWDGTVGGIIQPSGVYVWTMLALGYDKQMHNQSGTLVLIR